MSISQYLLPHERVLWEGQPQQGILFRPLDFLIIPFSLLWAGFALFWNYSVWTMPEGGPDWLFRLWGLPFLIAGFHITIGRFWHDAAIRRSTSYAVTTQRVIIERNGWRGTTMKSFDIRNLPTLEMVQKGLEGRGSIIFQPSSPFNMMWAGGGFDLWVPAMAANRFENIEQVAQTYQLIERTARSLNA